MQQMKGLKCGLQQTTLEKFISHPLIRDMLLEYLKDFNLMKCNLEILNNFKSGLTTHLLGACKTNLVVAKDIVCTLSSNQIVDSGRSFAKTLGVDKQNIKRAMGRKVQLDTIQNALWINFKQARCLDVMSQVMKDVVIE